MKLKITELLKKQCTHCVGCGQSHLYEYCPSKSAPTPDQKSEPFCCNCEKQHTTNFKSCKNFTIKFVFKMSFVDVTKNRKNTDSQNQMNNNDKISKKTSNLNSHPKMAPQMHDTIYHNYEIGNKVPRLFVSWKKLKMN